MIDAKPIKRIIPPTLTTPLHLSKEEDLNISAMVLTETDSSSVYSLAADEEQFTEETTTVSYVRDLQPTHFTLKIESFSVLQESELEYYESGEFEASGFNWKLKLYPNGNKSRGVNNDHISLYLAISDASELPQGCEINAHFKFFVYDNVRDKFLTIQDGTAGTKRFHRMRKEWGFDKFLSLDTLKDPSQRYLFNDCCIFGAEVFVIKNYGWGERLVTLKNPPNNTYTWKIKSFHSNSKSVHLSDIFVVGDYKWRIKCYPNGNGSSEGKALSLYLELVDPETIQWNRKVYADFSLRVVDQVYGKPIEENAKKWFSASESTPFGFHELLDLANLNSTTNGYLVNDTVIIEATINVISSSKNY